MRWASAAPLPGVNFSGGQLTPNYNGQGLDQWIVWVPDGQPAGPTSVCYNVAATGWRAVDPPFQIDGAVAREVLAPTAAAPFPVVFSGTGLSASDAFDVVAAGAGDLAFSTVEMRTRSQMPIPEIRTPGRRSFLGFLFSFFVCLLFWFLMGR